MLIYLSFEAESKMLNCIYCKTATFENGKGSKEHAILSALGGTKVSRNIDCKDCNNRLGTDIDISNPLSFISTILGVKTGRNKNAPVQKNIVSHEGENYNLLPGDKFQLSKTGVNFNNKAGQESVSITASNEEQALKTLNQVLRKWDKSIDDLPELKATHTKFYLPPVNIEGSWDIEKQLRSIAKMLLTYLATMIDPARLRNGQFEQVIQYIHKGDNNYNLSSCDFVSPVPSEPIISEINHRIFIFSSEEKKFVFGVLELFGCLKFSAVLTDTWDGGDINKVYIIDPTTGEHKELEITAPSTIFDFIDQRSLDINQMKNAFRKIKHAIKIRQFQKILSEIVNKSVENNWISDGETMTDAEYNNFINEISLEWTKFICRIPSTEVIDLKQPEFNENNNEC